MVTPRPTPGSTCAAPPAHPGPRLVGPLRRHGQTSRWSWLRSAVATEGAVIAHASLSDWAQDARTGGDLRRVLGADWPRYRDLRLEDAQRRFLAGRAFLKAVAAAALGTSAHAVDLGYAPGGRPHLRGHLGVDVNLSHTGDLVVAGVARHGRIGVDTESADRRLRLAAVDRAFWTPAEVRDLCLLPDPEVGREMVRLWTLKEAYAKALGQGLRMGFGEFGFTLDHPPTLRRPDGSPAPDEGWTFGTAAVDDRWTVSWALTGGGWWGRDRATAAPAPPSSALQWVPGRNDPGEDHVAEVMALLRTDPGDPVPPRGGLQDLRGPSSPERRSTEEPQELAKPQETQEPAEPRRTP